MYLIILRFAEFEVIGSSGFLDTFSWKELGTSVGLVLNLSGVRDDGNFSICFTLESNESDK